MKNSFQAQMGDWASKTQRRALAVLRDASQTVANEMRRPKAAGGNMPVLTGNLRRSLRASTTVMPSIASNKIKFESDPGAEITLTIASLQVGQTLHLGFQAAYSRIAEERDGFVRLTVQRWPQIVQASARKLEQRVNARSR